MDILKTVFALVAGILVAAGSELFGRWEFVDSFGLSTSQQLTMGVLLFVVSMAIHIVGGGRWLPGADL